MKSKELYMHLKRARDKFEEALHFEDTELLREALIQRFEYAFARLADLFVKRLIFLLARIVIRLSRKTNAFLDLNQPGERSFCCQFAP